MSFSTDTGGVNFHPDIIIPIYNAVDNLIACVNSVLKHTAPQTYRLILINDKSTDPKVEEFLCTIQSLAHPDIIVLENKVNVGFIKTVNKGMSYSNSDVLLLNSDTIASPGWLAKIQEAAYSGETIATVTPLTNNGTICSVPNFCEDNPIPKGFTLEEFALLIERVSIKCYPEIPTAVGFCMYIKRKVLNEIGLFDEGFGRGYGEENDFCCRAIAKGYVNILCDDTFVYHKGNMSFKEERAKLSENNSKLLARKHRLYFNNVEKFIVENPLKDIQNIIKLNLMFNNDKKNILYVLHNDFERGINHRAGGTEYHVKDLIENLPHLNPFVLISTGEELLLQAFINQEVLTFTFNLDEKLEYISFYSKRYEKIVESILKVFSIDLIHVHHLLNHTFDISKVAKQLGIPCAISLHDFYSICPSVSLLDANDEYCRDTRNPKMCQQCMKKRIGYEGNFLSKWNAQMLKFLSDFDKIYVPSYSTKAIIEEYYGDLNIKVIEHGADAKFNEIEKVENSAKYKIAFTGSLTTLKGEKIIKNLIDKNKNDKIEWNFFGENILKFPKNKKVVKHGRYIRQTIVETLKKYNIDLICSFSICPETYSFTLTESWLAGIPVLAHDMGALGERIKTHAGGWVIPMHTNTDEILNKIYQIMEDKNDYQMKKSIIKNMKIKTTFSMTQEYLKDYQKLYRPYDKTYAADPFDYQFIYNAGERNDFYQRIDIALKNDFLHKPWIKFLKKMMPQKVKNILRRSIYQIVKSSEKVKSLKASGNSKNALWDRANF